MGYGPPGYLPGQILPTYLEFYGLWAMGYGHSRSSGIGRAVLPAHDWSPGTYKTLSLWSVRCRVARKELQDGFTGIVFAFQGSAAGSFSLN